MQRVAKGMKNSGVSFDFILSSPYARALETAEIVAHVYREKKRVKTTELLAAEENPRDFVRHLKKNCRVSARILVAGHEPFLGRLASLLLIGRSGLSIRFKKAGLCKITLDSLKKSGGLARLDWLLTPCQLSCLG